MGYERHHALIITSWCEKHIKAAHDKAQRTFEKCPVSDVTEGVTNDYRSFAVFPDGSKEGWATSDEGDRGRDEYIAWLRTQEYEDGSSPLSWALVQFGDDDLVSKIVCDSDDTWRAAIGKRAVVASSHGTSESVATTPAAIKALARQAHDNAVEKGFWDTPPSTPTLIALMHSELSEALEADRLGNPPSEKIPDFTAVEEEMADLVIRVLDMSAAQGLRLGEAILAKMEYNRSRPHRHGGKAY